MDGKKGIEVEEKEEAPTTQKNKISTDRIRSPMERSIDEILGISEVMLPRNGMIPEHTAWD